MNDVGTNIVAVRLYTILIMIVSPYNRVARPHKPQIHAPGAAEEGNHSHLTISSDFGSGHSGRLASINTRTMLGADGAIESRSTVVTRYVARLVLLIRFDSSSRAVETSRRRFDP